MSVARDLIEDIRTIDEVTVTANSALPKSGGDLTGPVTTSSTIDGRTLSADGTKLDSIAVGANNYALPSDIATEGYVNTQVSALVDSSPATLDTLNELAAALGDDPNFATTMTTTLGDKYSKAETDSKIIELSPPATKSHVESLGILASSITGALPAIDGSALTNLPTGLPDQASHAGKSLTTDGTTASWADITPSEVTMHSFEYLGVAAQTVISGVDLDGNTLSYTPGNMRLYMDNGQLSTSEYTATDGTTITMITPLVGGEELVAVAFDSFVVADHYTKAETDVKIVELSPPATKSAVEALGIAASSITGALPAISGAALTDIVGVPSGIISMWSGLNAAIPAGWLLCDGTNGTPNLVDRFIVASGTAYTTGDTGGTDSVDSAGFVDSSGLSAGATTLSTAQIPSHTHVMQTRTTQSTNNNNNPYRLYLPQQETSSATQFASSLSTTATGGGGSHSHAMSGSATFTGSSTENRPQYYALAYIMKS
jgi:hypothetical protein